MKVYDLLKERKISEVLREKFPDLFEYSKRVEVIPWQEEYAIADKNPEVVDEIEFWKMMLESGLITQEEYEKKLIGLPSASKTLGIALMYEDKVSFREYPTDKVLLHELGHCFFKEPDPIWNELYGGGEMLLWLSLQTSLPINERNIISYHELLKMIRGGKTEEAHRIVLERLKELKLDCVPHVMGYALFMGTALVGTPSLDPRDKDLLKVKVEPFHLHSFLINVIIGALYRDPMALVYAEVLL